MTVIQALDGPPALALCDDSEVGGYVILAGLDFGDRLWRREVEESIHVDYAYTVTATLAMRTITVPLLIEGTDWDQVTARYEALLAAVEVHGWRLVVNGQTWKCDPADSTAPLPPDGSESTWRVVTLTVSARPLSGA